MIKPLIKRTLLFTTVFMLLANFTNAQVSQDNQLFKVLKAKDSLMFEVGFNHCNLEQIEQLLPEKFEFYHDKDGIITSRTAFIKSLNENLCSSGKTPTKEFLKKAAWKYFRYISRGNCMGQFKQACIISEIQLLGLLISG